MKPTLPISISIGQALDNYVTYRRTVYELISEISDQAQSQNPKAEKANGSGMAVTPGRYVSAPNPPSLSIAELDNQANEIALERVTRRVRHVDMDLFR